MKTNRSGYEKAKRWFLGDKKAGIIGFNQENWVLIHYVRAKGPASENSPYRKLAVKLSTLVKDMQNEGTLGMLEAKTQEQVDKFAKLPASTLGPKVGVVVAWKNRLTGEMHEGWAHVHGGYDDWDDEARRLQHNAKTPTKPDAFNPHVAVMKAYHRALGIDRHGNAVKDTRLMPADVHDVVGSSAWIERKHKFFSSKPVAGACANDACSGGHDAVSAG